ncbi:MAG: FmdB family zinc ribbon protein [Candidatus Goldiibacteriota bacterium]
MPAYNYECKKCGIFEVRQSMKENAFEKCPKCGGKEIKRLIGTGGGIIFKGSGFYETDYKRPLNNKKESEKTPCRDCKTGKEGACPSGASGD